LTVAEGEKRIYQEYDALIYDLCSLATIHKIKKMSNQEYCDYMDKQEEIFDCDLAPQEQYHIEQVFKTWDESQNERMDESEFAGCLRSMGKSDATAKRIAQNWFSGKIFRAIKTKSDRSGSIWCTGAPTILKATQHQENELSLLHFKVLWIQMREIQEKGPGEEVVQRWLATLDKDRNGLIEIKEFLKQEPLSGAAKYCSIDTENKVRQLFFNIRNPRDEDETVDRIRFHELALWISKLLKRKNANEEDTAEEG